MSKIKFKPIELSPKIQHILTEIADSYTNGIIETRAQAILELWSGKSIKEVSRHLNYNRQSIGKFRKRFQENAMFLNTLSETEEITFAQLKREIESVLSDLHRTGRHLEYSLDQRARIIGIACSDPADLGYPLAYMTVPVIREEAIKSKIVNDISLSTVWRILNEAHLKPHKTHPWLNSDARIKDPEDYDRRVRAICSLYIEVAKSEVQDHTYFYCLDEKTGIRALERRAPDKLARPNKTAKLEHGYIRHGSINFFGAFNFQTGKILTPPFFRTSHKEKDWLDFIKSIIQLDPIGSFTFVCDNLSTHVSESLVRYIADVLNIKKDLGVKRKCGILFDKNSRRRFLEDPTHRIRFLFTPPHSSWLNQIEIWFSVISKQLYNRKSFPSMGHLITDTFHFIERYNLIAKPFTWKYKGTSD